jgi:hypothetical protein
VPFQAAFLETRQQVPDPGPCQFGSKTRRFVALTKIFLQKVIYTLAKLKSRKEAYLIFRKVKFW